MEKELSVAMEVRMLNCSYKDPESVKFLKIAVFILNCSQHTMLVTGVQPRD